MFRAVCKFTTGKTEARARSLSLEAGPERYDVETVQTLVSTPCDSEYAAVEAAWKTLRKLIDSGKKVRVIDNIILVVRDEDQNYQGRVPVIDEPCGRVDDSSVVDSLLAAAVPASEAEN